MDPLRPPRAPSRPRWWAAPALLLATACVHIRGTADQPAVFSFRIEGMHALSEGDLEKRLATRASDRSPPIPIVGPLLHQVQGARQELGALQQKPPIPVIGPILYALRGSGKNEMVSLLDPDQLAVDRQRVEAYYRDHGYYDARVVDVQVVPVGEGQVAVTMKVVEGQPVRVTRIDIEGLDQAPQAEAALKKPALRVGGVFAVSAYDALRDQLAAALHDDGWATGEVKQDAQVLPEEHSATVKYTVTPGQRFKFGPILVAGTGKVPRDRVRERAGDVIKPGAWYDERTLAQAQSRVFNMGVFGGVRVSRGTPDPERGIIPILVAVREAPFRTVRAGPSVGVVSNSRIDLSGLAGWTNRNFLGDLRRLDLSLTAGYAWLLTGTKSHGPIGTLAADFSQPELFSRAVDLGAHAELQRGVEQGYEYWAQRGRLSLPIRLTRRVTFTPSYNLEVYELDHATVVPNPNDPTRPLPSPVLASCRDINLRTGRGVCLLSYLEQRIQWDGRDDPIDTRRGFYLALSVQEGTHMGGYGYQYLRFLPEARAYLPVGEQSVLAARARIGAFIPVNESSDPPTVALFEAGGANSMRGYGQNRLSPMACVPTTVADENNPGHTKTVCTNEWIPVGGNGLAEYSLEFRFPLRGSLVGAVFTDAAYVSARSAVPTAWRSALGPGHLQWAAGFGIRYRTPVGPLRLDLAARLPEDFSSGVDFNHRFPAEPATSPTHREPIVAFHLTVGEPF